MAWHLLSDNISDISVIYQWYTNNQRLLFLSIFLANWLDLLPSTSDWLAGQTNLNVITPICNKSYKKWFVWYCSSNYMYVALNPLFLHNKVDSGHLKVFTVSLANTFSLLCSNIKENIQSGRHWALSYICHSRVPIQYYNWKSIPWIRVFTKNQN